MKVCTKCDFSTRMQSYNICPICGERLEIFKGKQKFTVGVSGDDAYSSDIEMTYDEALIVERVINELMEKQPFDSRVGVFIDGVTKDKN